MVFIEIIEGMEELLLGGLLAGDKLDIVHQEEVGIAVFVAEFRVFALLERLNQLVGELIALDVDYVVVRVAVVDLPGDGVEEVGFAKAAGAVDEKGVIGLGGTVGHGDGRGVGEAVGRPHHEPVKGELGVILDKLGGSALLLVGLHLFAGEHLHLHIHVEELLHGVLNVADAAGFDDILPKLRRRVEHQLVFGELHHLGIVKPGGDHGGAQEVFHVSENLRPDVGRRVHDRLLSMAFPWQLREINRIIQYKLYHRLYCHCKESREIFPQRRWITLWKLWKVLWKMLGLGAWV